MRCCLRVKRNLFYHLKASLIPGWGWRKILWTPFLSKTEILKGKLRNRGGVNQKARNRRGGRLNKWWLLLGLAAECDGIPVVEKAVLHAKARDDLSGISTSSNPFTVLNKTPDVDLQSIILDLDIVSNDIKEQIGVFRAEEIARAAVAEANYKCFLEKQKSKGWPNSEEFLEDLNMGIISNDARNKSPSLTKGVSEEGLLVNCSGVNSNQANNEDLVLEC